ncbi:hypothetical protein BCV70DRAFT_32577 [Testicularia cyperi]|uniref:Uncharacterized protein n=1 Tax=Testicularia cyperi TaxID=1882483 RepID=A0A317XKZ1_9BASI|nr:hypothetical protein BCV70DRAFT_32577 [Testicularia cyperi]
MLRSLANAVDPSGTLPAWPGDWQVRCGRLVFGSIREVLRQKLRWLALVAHSLARSHARIYLLCTVVLLTTVLRRICNRVTSDGLRSS